MRNFSVIECEQRSELWHQARLGRVTSSVSADMMAAPKRNGDEPAARRNLRVRLAVERITGRSVERDFQTQAMKDGVEREPEAIAAYESLTGELVERTGFLAHNELMAGASLDGHLGNFDGLIEVKCPTPAVHWDYVRSATVPAAYKPQILMALWLSGAAWADFVSYSPHFPDGARLKTIRVEREVVELDGFELLLRQFIREVDIEQAEIVALAAKGAA